MKAILMAGAMTLTIVANAQAGWFGLTEDYPFKAPGADRTSFISTALQVCVRKTTNGENRWHLSSSQTLYVCNCRARKLANIFTKTELDYVMVHSEYSPKLVAKVADFDLECLQDMIDDTIAK
jgi:hypothetical protein